MFALTTHSPQETHRLGKRIAECLEVGTVVALRGDLATGKTTLITGICEGLAVQQAVESPTYTLVNEYQGRLPVYHMDCYREHRLAEWIELGIEEYFFGEGITLIEWAGRIESILPQDVLYIDMDHVRTDHDCRRLRMSGNDHLLTCITRQLKLPAIPQEQDG